MFLIGLVGERRFYWGQYACARGQKVPVLAIFWENEDFIGINTRIQEQIIF